MIAHCKSRYPCLYRGPSTNALSSVNEIFDPSSVDKFFCLDTLTRQKCLQENKVTNYSVVRLPLLESLYEKIYRQKLLDPNPTNWPMRLITDHEITGLQEQSSTTLQSKVKLQMKNLRTGAAEVTDDDYDLVVFATGYKSNTTSGTLKGLASLLRSPAPGQFSVNRDYRLQFLDGKVARDAGVWLQGYCENTHGVCFYPFCSPPIQIMLTVDYLLYS